MTHEHQPTHKKPYEVYGFTKKERLYWRVSQEHFEAILKDDLTIVHDVLESSNNSGDFLFVTTSRPYDHGRTSMTFYGLGYHEYRERWITDEWYWYQINFRPQMAGQQISKEEVSELLKEQLEGIQPHIESTTQSERGRLFEMLADLTDEDGALAELQDLGDDWQHFFDDPDA